MSQVKIHTEEMKMQGTDFKVLYDNSGNTGLHLAAANGHKDVIEYLIDEKLTIDLLNAYGTWQCKFRASGKKFPKSNSCSIQSN